MKKVFEKAKKEFESIMYCHCREYIMDEPDYPNWNIRDYVSECQYYIDLQMDNEPEMRDDVTDCKNFVKKYRKNITDMEATARHISKYD